MDSQSHSESCVIGHPKAQSFLQSRRIGLILVPLAAVVLALGIEAYPISSMRWPAAIVICVGGFNALVGLAILILGNPARAVVLQGGHIALTGKRRAKQLIRFSDVRGVYLIPDRAEDSIPPPTVDDLARGAVILLILTQPWESLDERVRKNLRTIPIPSKSLGTAIVCKSYAESAFEIASAIVRFFPNSEARLRVELLLADGPVAISDSDSVSGSLTRANVPAVDRCIGCGYDLRELAGDGRCPECGLAVSKSKGGRLLARADLGWIRAISKGSAILMASGPVLFLMIGLLFWTFRGMRRGLPAGGYFSSSLMGFTLALSVVSLGGVLLTKIEPTVLGSLKEGRSRIIARTLLAAAPIVMFASLFLTPALFVLGGGLVVLVVGVLLTIASELLKRIPERRLSIAAAVGAVLFRLIAIGPISAFLMITLNTYFPALRGNMAAAATRPAPINSSILLRIIMLAGMALVLLSPTVIWVCAFLRLSRATAAIVHDSDNSAPGITESAER